MKYVVVVVVCRCLLATIGGFFISNIQLKINTPFVHPSTKIPPPPQYHLSGNNHVPRISPPPLFYSANSIRIRQNIDQCIVPQTGE